MEKKEIQRASFKILTYPISIVVLFVRLFNYNSLISDYRKCVAHLQDHDDNLNAITESLIESLVLAEDHRSHLHFGVDHYSIFRALVLRVLEGKVQGASTIEQQFVRTVTNRYERTIRRKVREQVISVMLSSGFTKKQIAKAYLGCAFFGSGLIGSDGIRLLKENNFSYSDEAIIACLKYPRPLSMSDAYKKKHSNRVEHIKLLRLNGCSREAALITDILKDDYDR